MLSKAELILRLYSPNNGVLSLLRKMPTPLVCTQVRGKKQKFGGATRDPFKSLQRKLLRSQERKHAKVPLMSEERSQIRRLVPINATSLGIYAPTTPPNLQGYVWCHTRLSFFMQAS